MTLKLAKGLELPLEAVTQTWAILAKRRAGKSYLARKLVEQLHRAGQQLVIADPKGDWWGVRAHRDGKRPGLPIMILGGERGDLPLEPGAGEVVAKLIVEERVSVLLDLSLLRKHEVATFMGTFLEQLYRLKAREAYRTPALLVIDEADAIAPQKPQPNEARLLGAAEDLVRRGGQRGIGTLLITQRAAVLNKNVLTQAQILIALRTIAPQDLKAMNEWVDVHGSDAERKTLMGSLPSLPIGDAWVWSPGWPTSAGIFHRIHVDSIETFDSGATPKPGEKRAEPKTLADVDLEALRRQMAETIERAKAEDPRELRATIAGLRKELAAAKAAQVPTPPPAPTVERAALGELERMVEQHGKAYELMAVALQRVRDSLAQAPKGGTGHGQSRVIAPAAASAGAVSRQAPGVRAAGERLARGALAANGTLTGPEQRILDAIAWLESIGNEEPEQTATAFLAGYTVGGGAWANPRGSLRSKGLLEYLSGDRLRLTEEGRALANRPEATLTSEELQARVLERLGGPEGKILRALIDAYPGALSFEDLAARAGYAAGGGAFANPRGRLRTLGLIDYPEKGTAVARPILFVG